MYSHAPFPRGPLHMPTVCLMHTSWLGLFKKKRQRVLFRKQQLRRRGSCLFFHVTVRRWEHFPKTCENWAQFPPPPVKTWTHMFQLPEWKMHWVSAFGLSPFNVTPLFTKPSSILWDSKYACIGYGIHLEDRHPAFLSLCQMFMYFA